MLFLVLAYIQICGTSSRLIVLSHTAAGAPSIARLPAGAHSRLRLFGRCCWSVQSEMRLTRKVRVFPCDLHLCLHLAHEAQVV